MPPIPFGNPLYVIHLVITKNIVQAAQSAYVERSGSEVPGCWSLSVIQRKKGWNKHTRNHCECVVLTRPFACGEGQVRLPSKPDCWYGAELGLDTGDDL